MPRFWHFTSKEFTLCCLSCKWVLFQTFILCKWTCASSPLPPIAYMQPFPHFILPQLQYFGAVWVMLVLMCQSSARTQYFFPFCPTDTSIRVKPRALNHQEERSKGKIPLAPRGQAVSSPASNSIPPKLNRVTVKHFHVMSHHPPLLSTLHVFIVCANLLTPLQYVWLNQCKMARTCTVQFGTCSDGYRGEAVIAVDSSIYLLKQRSLTSLNIEYGRDDQYEHSFKIKSGFINPLAQTFFHPCHLCVCMVWFSVKGKENCI